jgi:hypothetical protein
VGATLTDFFWRWKSWLGCVVLFGGVSLVSLWLARISSRPLDRLDSAEIESVGD